MRSPALWLIFGGLRVSLALPAEQKPLQETLVATRIGQDRESLHGRFLHITGKLLRGRYF